MADMKILVITAYENLNSSYLLRQLFNLQDFFSNKRGMAVKYPSGKISYMTLIKTTHNPLSQIRKSIQSQKPQSEATMEVYYQFDGDGFQKPMSKLQAELQCNRLRALINKARPVRTNVVGAMVRAYHANAANGACVSR